MKNLIFACVLATLSMSAHSAQITGTEANCPSQNEFRGQIYSESAQAMNNNQISFDLHLVITSALNYTRSNLFDLWVPDMYSPEERNDAACRSIQSDLERVQEVLIDLSKDS